MHGFDDAADSCPMAVDIRGSILFPSHHVIALYKSVSRQQLLSPLQSLPSQ